MRLERDEEQEGGAGERCRYRSSGHCVLSGKLPNNRSAAAPCQEQSAQPMIRCLLEWADMGPRSHACAPPPLLLPYTPCPLSSSSPPSTQKHCDGYILRFQGHCQHQLAPIGCGRKSWPPASPHRAANQPAICRERHAFSSGQGRHSWQTRTSLSSK